MQDKDSDFFRRQGSLMPVARAAPDKTRKLLLTPITIKVFPTMLPGNEMTSLRTLQSSDLVSRLVEAAQKSCLSTTHRKYFQSVTDFALILSSVSQSAPFKDNKY